MSAFRLGRLPDGTRDVRVCDDGAVGRTTHARYGIAGGGPPTVTGSFVIGLPKPKPDPHPRAERLFEGVVRCGLWMPQAQEKCYRRIGHADKCLTVGAVNRDTERRRRLKYGDVHRASTGGEPKPTIRSERLGDKALADTRWNPDDRAVKTPTIEVPS